MEGDETEWLRYYDDLNSRFYLYNPATKETKWEPAVGEAERSSAIHAYEAASTRDSETSGVDRSSQRLSCSDFGDVQDTPVPEGWGKYFSEEAGRHYYVNLATNETQWEAPGAIATEADAVGDGPGYSAGDRASKLAAANDMKGDLYDVVEDATSGRMYYVNIVTHETSWTLPPGAQIAKKTAETQTSREPSLNVPAGVLQNSIPSLHERTYDLGGARISEAHGPLAPPVNRMAHPSLPKDLMSDLHRFRFEDYARDHFTSHKTGFIFRRKVPLKEMMLWQKAPLTKPLLQLAGGLEKDAKNLFKFIQSFMGDRPSRMDACAIASSIVTLGITRSELRDEIYVQIRKQCSENTSEESERLGWSLMVMCAASFAPSRDLEGYMFSDLQEVAGRPDPHALYAKHITHLLTTNTANRSFKSTFDAKDALRYSSPSYLTSQFGCPISEIMLKQRLFFPDETTPHIVTVLIDQIKSHGGFMTEGIFRLPACSSSLEEMKEQLEHGNYDVKAEDAHVPACLLKLWFRSLPEPIFPEDLYDACLKASSDEQAVLSLCNSIPSIHHAVLKILCDFLREMTAPEIVKQTMMSSENFAVVFVPNLIKGQPKDPYQDVERLKRFINTVIVKL